MTDSNPFVLAVIGLVLIVLIVFLIVRNKKDRKQLEDQLNQDFKKTKDADHTSDPDDLKDT